MKLAVFVVVAIVSSLAISARAEVDDNGDLGPAIVLPPTENLSNLPSWMRRLLAQAPPMYQTCGRDPGVCSAIGSPGPNCCNKKCVNFMADNLNCGRCGKKCKYKEACCGGKCVNLSSDDDHCGRCSNKCNEGIYCVYGLCDYAA